MTATETLRVRGENGVVFDVDVPPEGTPARRLHDSFVESGRLEVLDTLDQAPDPEAVEDTPEIVANVMAAALERVRALDDDGQDEVMRLLDDRFDGGVVLDLPFVPPAGSDSNDGPAPGERPKVRDDVEVWRTYRAGQGHKVDGLNKTQLQELPDTPKEG